MADARVLAQEISRPREKLPGRQGNRHDVSRPSGGTGDGTPYAITEGVIHLGGLAHVTPQLPARTWTAAAARMLLSATLHLMAATAVVSVFAHARPVTVVEKPRQPNAEVTAMTHLVFIARESPRISGGGGGGGNRQTGPIRHAEGIGHDAITLRTTLVPPSLADNQVARDALPSVLLDARPLASGTADVLGLPVGGVSYGTSTGPGTGGGVGEGTGTGIGSGNGPGLGPGSGGGIGGGVYTPGGAVAPPRVIHEVKPTYTADALLRKIQGRVLLELVVNREGRAQNVHVVRSLDPGGLDEQAVAAAREWRFLPGRVSGTPVNVVVTIALDFWIQ